MIGGAFIGAGIAILLVTMTMGIAQLKEQLSHLPGINGLTMQYGKGTEIYIMGDLRVEIPAGATHDDAVAALTKVASPSALAAVDSAVDALKKKELAA